MEGIRTPPSLYGIWEKGSYPSLSQAKAEGRVLAVNQPPRHKDKAPSPPLYGIWEKGSYASLCRAGLNVFVRLYPCLTE